MLVEIRSRRWNFVIGVLGVVYAIAALILLIVHFMQTLGAASIIDRAIQIALVTAVAVSIWFILIAARGLGIQLRRKSGTRVASPA
jgi:uncharacterized membrane protein